MEKQNYAIAGAGSLCCFAAVGFAYLTAWLNWNHAVHHSLAAILAIIGLWLIWYGFHKNYYERVFAKALKEVETAAEIDKQ